jgi:hypothetical protein
MAQPDEKVWDAWSKNDLPPAGHFKFFIIYLE